MSTQVKFGEWIDRGFTLYKENLGVLILATLVAMVLSTVTVGVLAGPLLVGLAILNLALYDRKEPKPTVGTVFEGFQLFLNGFLYFLVYVLALLVGNVVLNLIPCIGSIAAMAYGVFVGAAVVFVPFLIADKKMDFWPAIMASKDKILENFWPFIGLVLVASVLGLLGAILCGIGMVLTMPIYTCIVTVAYRESFGADAAEVTEAEVVTETPAPEEAAPENPASGKPGPDAPQTNA